MSLSKKLFYKTLFFSTLFFTSFSFGNESANGMQDAALLISKNSSSQIKKEEIPAPSSQTINIMDYKIQIGGNYTYVNFTPKNNDSFHGSLGGAQAMFEYIPTDRFYGAAKFIYRQGNTTGSAGKRSFLWFDVQERLGYTFAFEDNTFLLRLFSGFGYHYIGQHLTNSVNTDSLRFGYNEFYVPVGFVTTYDVNSYFNIGLEFTWMAQLYPAVSIVPLKGANWDLQYKFLNFYASMPFTFALTTNKKYLLTINPFYEHWNDGASTAKLSTGIPLNLPSNNYNFYGVDLNFSFCF